MGCGTLIKSTHQGDFVRERKRVEFFGRKNKMYSKTREKSLVVLILHGAYKPYYTIVTAVRQTNVTKSELLKMVEEKFDGNNYLLF